MKKVRKVFDCFNLSHEPIKLLLLRLRTHYDHVDHFCINENAITYSGVEREWVLPKYEKELEPYMDKIIYRQIDIRERNIDWSTFKQDYHSDRDEEDKRTWPVRWQRSMYGRDCLIESPLEHASDDDIIIQSDLDEIILPEALADIQGWFTDPRAIYTGHQKFFMCHVNRLMYENGEPVEKWRGPQFCTLAYMKAFGGFNTCRNPGKGPDHVKEYLIDGCGWHFSFLGGNDKIKEKLQGYGHQEHNNDMVKDNLEENIKNNKDILGRGYYDYRIVPFDPEEYPRELVLNQEFYEEFIYADN